jgi:hypothetical protein
LKGGAVYLAEQSGEFLIITDESAMWDLLDEEDLEGMQPCTVRKFTTDADREAYLIKRRWLK